MSKIKSFNYLMNRFGRNQHLVAAILLLIVLAFFYRDVVFYHRTFLMETAAAGTMPNSGPYQYKGAAPGFVANDPGAIASQIEPFNRFISRSIKKGDFLLWNPHAGLAGAPLMADGHTGPLEPIQFLFFFLPDHLWPLAIDGQLLIRFFLAGFGCYLFARRQGIHFLGSMSAGLMFMLSSYFVTFGNHPQVKTEVLLPLVLYGYDRLVDAKDRAGFWLCALFIGWAVIAAMPESTFFVLVLSTLWYFYKSIFQWHNTDKVFHEAIRLILRYMGSTAIGFLISAAYLFPFLEYAFLAKSTHSPGTGGDAYALSLLPGLLFQIQTKFYLHIGFFAAFSLIFSLLNLKAWMKYRRHIIFFSLYAVIFILTLFGFPLTNWIRDLPVFNQLIVEKYSIPSIVFCLAILMGILIDRAGTLPLSYKKLSFFLLTLFIIFVGFPMIKNLESISNFSSDIEFIYGAVGLMIGISIMLYVLAFYQRRYTFNHGMVQFALLIIVTLEPFFWGTRIHRSERFDPFQVPPFISYLVKQEDFRIFGFDGILYPNVSTAYGISDVRWLHALAPERAYDFSATFIESAEVTTMRLTGSILPISDKMFNLLNVKYILTENTYIEGTDHCSFTTAPQPYFGRDTLNSLIFEQNQGKEDFFPGLPLDINGATRVSIFAQSPQRFNLDLTLPKEASNLDFSIGLNPDVFLPEHGDGVTFRIVLLEQENRVELFSKYIDPKNRPCDRKWFDESINLENWAGKDVALRFIITGGPSGDHSYDWAYWGDIRLTTPTTLDKVDTEITDIPYSLVHRDKDVLIYQNKDAFPRAFVVYQVKNVASFSHALDVINTLNLDLRQVGVVENLPTELENTINQNNLQMQSVDGSVKFINSGELHVKVSTEAPGLLIVSEQYYPGWNAYVDGKPTQIYAVDGILRGIFLEAGDHIIEFKYRPLSFIIGGILSAASLLTTMFFLIFYTRAAQNIIKHSSYCKEQAEFH